MAQGILKVLVPAIVAWILYSYFMGTGDEDLSGLKEKILGKKVLITGASSGIGAAMAYQYAEMGANIVVTGRREDRLQKVVARCKELGVKSAVHNYIKADMSKPKETRTVVSKAAKLLGGLDVLMLNHAKLDKTFLRWKGTEEDIAILRDSMEVTFASYVLLVSDALPLLEQSSGSVGVTSSLHGHSHFLNEYAPTYVSAKHAKEGFFYSLRSELINKGSNVSITLFPLGHIDTEGLKICGKDLLSHHPVPKPILAAPVDGAARGMIRGAAMREWNVWYPAYQKHWWITLLNHMFPQYMAKKGNLVRSLFFSPY